jgi:uncharacterized protein (TIGR02271 family)
VKTGLFGTKASVVPIAGSSISGDDVVVPFSKDQVKDAPNFDTDQPLSEADESRLYEHYQMARGASYAGAGAGEYSGSIGGDYTTTTGTGIGTSTATSGAVGGYERSEGHDTSGPNTDNAMTRSEERLHVGKESVQTGVARLRKYIVTENVTQTVPVSHEEVRIEREPITDANRDAALAGPDLSEEEHEVVLTEERIVTSKETVPVERVRLATETVTGEQQVNESVRKEQIDTEGVTDSADDVYPTESSTTRARETTGL